MSSRLPDYANLTPDAITATCEAAIAACNVAVAEIIAIPAAERTYANTLLAIEQAEEPVAVASGAWAFMAYVAADDALRETAREWDERLDKYMVGLGFNEDLYRAVREFADSPAASALTGEDARLLERTLRDYRRNGFEKPADDRHQLRMLFDELVELGTQFRQAIDDWDDGIEVTREDLDGLPESFINGLKRVGPLYRVSLDYPELQPYMANARSVHWRRELFEKDQRKGGLENVARLERAIAVRTEIAQLLGYESWADYAIEPRMAKRRETVADFIEDLRDKVAIKAEADMKLLADANEAALGSREVNIWDWRFAHNELMKTTFAVNDFEVAKYFPLDACLRGLFDVTQGLLGVRFVEVPDAPTWHQDVRAFDITEADGGEPFARFYMDLFPRPNKYGHAAAFTLLRGRQLPDGTYQEPASAIVANFTKPTAEHPSLLRHSEVIVLFHEFGHVLHQTLTRAQRARFSGTNTERDFVEAPSQMLEHWCWEPSVLRGFARHYETSEPLPEELLASMVAAKNASSGVTTLRQLLFATLDLTYHSPGFDGDSTATLQKVHHVSGFPMPEGTYFQAGFGHLFGYDAGYYGYMWSHVFGDDMYTKFEAASPMDPEIGGFYRRTILERGGSVDGDQLVRDFLGREPNNQAFLRGLGLEL